MKTAKRIDLTRVGMFVVLPLILCLFMQGCITRKACERKFPPQVITKDTTSHIETIIRHDTVFWGKPDSAGWTAYFECRKNKAGQMVPTIINQQTTSGNNLHVTTSQSGTQTGLNVSVQCKSDSLKTVITLLEKTIKDFRAKDRTVIKEVNVLTSWQSFQIWTGRIFLAIILIGLIVLGVKFGLKRFI